MKMMYNGTEIKSLNIKHYEIDSNFATVEPSDMQAGKTAVARGKKITGTGKSFEFAQYGTFVTNTDRFVPSNINVIEVTSTDYPVKSILSFKDMNNVDFSVGKIIATIVVDGIEYDLSVSVNSNILTISCEKQITLQVFYGKDNYV